MTVSSASGAGRVRAGAHATSRNTNAQGDNIFFGLQHGQTSDQTLEDSGTKDLSIQPSAPAE